MPEQQIVAGVSYLLFLRVAFRGEYLSCHNQVTADFRPFFKDDYPNPGFRGSNGLILAGPSATNDDNIRLLICHLQLDSFL